MASPFEHDPFLKSAPRHEGYPVLPPCVIYHRLGQGGMGAVYQARHLRLDLDVAVKCLDPSLGLDGEVMVKRFQDEARLAAAINHQNLVRVYDVAREGTLHYLIMEFIPGETLRQHARRRGPLPAGEAAGIIAGAAQGLGAAHRRGVVHRDVKPDNVMIALDGTVKVVDLGLARAVSGGLKRETLTEHSMGTPRYIPPEQWRSASEVGSFTDVWALGASLWFLLAGRDPIQADDLHQAMFQIVNNGPPSLREVRDDLPDELIAVVEKATAIDPRQRHPDANSLAEALLPFAEALPKESLERSDPTQIEAPPRETLERLRDAVLTPSAVPFPSEETIRLDDAGAQPPTVQLPPEAPRRSEPPLAVRIVFLLCLGGLIVWGWPKLFGEDPQPGPENPKTEHAKTDPDPSKDDPKPGPKTPEPKKNDSTETPKETETKPVELLIPIPSLADQLSLVGENAQGFQEYSVKRDPSVVLVRIPAASFLRGASDGHENERPVHLVTLSEYYIGKYEITNEQYQRYCKESGAERPPRVEGSIIDPYLVGGRRPVGNVNWNEARGYCRWLGAAGTRHFGDLPTEAQWEYAARGPKGWRYAWGNATPRKDLAHFGQMFSAGPRPVGSFLTAPSPFGTFDQSGNVSEWCRDWLGPYGNESLRDPLGPNSGPGRILRGGCWYRFLDEKDTALRATARGFTRANGRNVAWGFRVCFTP